MKLYVTKYDTNSGSSVFLCEVGIELYGYRDMAAVEVVYSQCADISAPNAPEGGQRDGNQELLA